jgi:ribosomal protein L11 methylase PrmA
VALLAANALQAGTDVEPLAVKATRANAALNGVGDRLAVYQCAGGCQRCLPASDGVAIQPPLL